MEIKKSTFRKIIIRSIILFISIFSVSYVVYKIREGQIALEKARIATEEWGKKQRRLGIDDLDYSDPQSIQIANMRIYNSNLSDEEKQNLSSEVYEKYYEYNAK